MVQTITAKEIAQKVITTMKTCLSLMQEIRMTSMIGKSKAAM
jgi:hypothetical protein